MLSPVAAIRAGHTRPRFVQSQPLHRQSRLGLPRRPRLAAATSSLTLHPRAAIRNAARSLRLPEPRRPSSSALRLVLRADAQVSWTRRTVDGLRAAREGSAAAWRG